MPDEQFEKRYNDFCKSLEECIHGEKPSFELTIVPQDLFCFQAAANHRGYRLRVVSPLDLDVVQVEVERGL